MESPYDSEAIRVSSAIAPGRRLVVIGSTSFWGPDSRSLCEAIAADLAALAKLVVLTGGMDGVGLTFGRAFADARRSAGQPENLFHLLPRGRGPCNNGITLSAGIDYHESREVLGRVGHAYLVIEGGPGTEHEAAVAAGRGAPVIPVGRTGGHAGALHSRASCPPFLPRADWDLLADVGASHSQVVAAVGRLVRLALEPKVVTFEKSRILKVTRGGFEYRDDDGRACLIDFEVRGIGVGNSRYVGYRDFGARPPYFEFPTLPPTRFVFEVAEGGPGLGDWYQGFSWLEEQIRKVGRRTFDLS
jgi:hypothetical protein